MVEHNQSTYNEGSTITCTNSTISEEKAGGAFDERTAQRAELDDATQMYYYGARYYDPRISIFISVDPLVEETMEPYLYTGNNPIMFTDPTGMNKVGGGPKLYTNTNNARGIITNGFNSTKYGKYSNYNWFSTTPNAKGTGRVGSGITLGIEGVNVSNAVEISNKQMNDFYKAAKTELGYTSEQLRNSSKMRSEVDGLKFSKLGEWMNKTGASSYKLGDSYAVADAVANQGTITTMSGSANSIKALNGLKVAGRTLMAVGVALDAYEIYSSGYNPRVITGVAGGWGGAWLGAQAGAELGAGLGSLFPGAGNVIGGVAGGIIGGAAGYFTGKAAAQTVYDKVTTKGISIGK